MCDFVVVRFFQQERGASTTLQAKPAIEADFDSSSRLLFATVNSQLRLLERGSRLATSLTGSKAGPVRYKTPMKRALYLLPMLFAMFIMVGCDQVPSPPPEVNDDTYTSDVSVKGQWQVRFDGRVTIEIDQEGVVNVYGITYTSGNSTYRPDVKVSSTNGTVFKVYNAHNVKADDGVTLHAYNSGLVKASHQARVFAYNCDNVLAVHDAGLIEPHGNTQVQRMSGPAPVKPAAPADTTGSDPTKK